MTFKKDSPALTQHWGVLHFPKFKWGKLCHVVNYVYLCTVFKNNG